MQSGKLELSELQLEALGHWVVLADNLGVSRSLGQLYGLLFMFSSPLTAQNCADLLKISRSSAGQGLKTLKELGAIKSTFALGDRSERFIIEPDLGILVQGLIDGKLLPALTIFSTSMQALSGERERFVSERIEKLQRWGNKLEAKIEILKKEIR